MWSSDALNVVKEINNNQEPGGWYTRHNILQIRANFKGKNWSLSWNERSSNCLADALAKHALRFDLNFCNLKPLPATALNIVVEDILEFHSET